MKGEPTLEQIEDYNGKESKTKRNTVRLVILFCISVGIVYSLAKYFYSEPDEYIGTKENPGINVTNN
ncbi:MAG: hypothetical protein CSA86_03290 [Arcobacter sp.]|nr:MAG: hypothetical protein CSA86_03290 [Arcobacter sp.]